MNKRNFTREELEPRDDHDLLIINVMNTQHLGEKLDQHVSEYHPARAKKEADAAKTMNKRVGRLEGFRWWFLGVWAAIGSTVGFVIWFFG